MRYFERLRVEWIVETIRIFGFINREHVVRKFDVTPQVVSKDFATVQKLHPGLMSYDTSTKCYWLKE